MIYPEFNTPADVEKYASASLAEAARLPDGGRRRREILAELFQLFLMSMQGYGFTWSEIGVVLGAMMRKHLEDVRNTGKQH